MLPLAGSKHDPMTDTLLSPSDTVAAEHVEDPRHDIEVPERITARGTPWYSLGRRNESAGYGLGNGGAVPPRPMRFERHFSENEHLAYDEAGNRIRSHDFIDLWRSIVVAAQEAGLLPLDALGLATALAARSDARGKPVQVGHKTLGAGLISEDTVGRHMQVLQGLGLVVRQRLDYLVVEDQVPHRYFDPRTGEHKAVKNKNGQTKTDSGWVVNDRDDVNLFKQPAMTGFRIPSDLVRLLDGMVNMHGKPVIRRHEKSFTRRAVARAGHDVVWVDRGIAFYQTRRAHLHTVRTTMESDLSDPHVQAGEYAAHTLEELLHDVPLDHRTAVRQYIQAWLRCRAQRTVRQLDADGVEVDAKTLDQVVPDRVRAWTERFMRRRRQH